MPKIINDSIIQQQDLTSLTNCIEKHLRTPPPQSAPVLACLARLETAGIGRVISATSTPYRINPVTNVEEVDGYAPLFFAFHETLSEIKKCRMSTQHDLVESVTKVWRIYADLTWNACVEAEDGIIDESELGDHIQIYTDFIKNYPDSPCPHLSNIRIDIAKNLTYIRECIRGLTRPPRNVSDLAKEGGMLILRTLIGGGLVGATIAATVTPAAPVAIMVVGALATQTLSWQVFPRSDEWVTAWEHIKENKAHSSHPKFASILQAVHHIQTAQAFDSSFGGSQIDELKIAWSDKIVYLIIGFKEVFDRHHTSQPGLAHRIITQFLHTLIWDEVYRASRVLAIKYLYEISIGNGKYEKHICQKLAGIYDILKEKQKPWVTRKSVTQAKKTFRSCHPQISNAVDKAVQDSLPSIDKGLNSKDIIALIDEFFEKLLHINKLSKKEYDDMRKRAQELTGHK